MPEWPEIAQMIFIRELHCNRLKNNANEVPEEECQFFVQMRYHWYCTETIASRGRIFIHEV